MRKDTQRTAKRIGTMDIILILVGIALVVFTAVMLYFFAVFGAIPDTLCTCVFAALGGECGIMGWIKTAKEKYKTEDKDDETEG